MMLGIDKRLSKLEASAAYREPKRVSVFCCTVRQGHEDGDAQEAYAALGDRPGEGDVSFRTIYMERDLGELAGFTPKAERLTGWPG